MGAPGFDDAPLAEISCGPPKDIQFVYPYYDNPMFLTRQLEMWSSYASDIRQRLRVIVVDDGSPTTPAIEVVQQRALPFQLRLFRIGVDVRWNWLAARNIGMHHAHDGWCMITDMDHMLTEMNFRTLVGGAHDERVIYRFSRVEADGRKIHPHPNSMLMTRAMFWKVGGYDERLSGFYGTDGDWRRRCAATAKILTLNTWLRRHEHDGDSSTVRYLRKQPVDAHKKPLLEMRKRMKNWTPKTLSFPYHEVPVCA